MRGPGVVGEGGGVYPCYPLLRLHPCIWPKQLRQTMSNFQPRLKNALLFVETRFCCAKKKLSKSKAHSHHGAFQPQEQKQITLYMKHKVWRARNKCLHIQIVTCTVFLVAKRKYWSRGTDDTLRLDHTCFTSRITLLQMDAEGYNGSHLLQGSSYKESNIN